MTSPNIGPPLSVLSIAEHGARMVSKGEIGAVAECAVYARLTTQVVSA